MQKLILVYQCVHLDITLSLFNDTPTIIYEGMRVIIGIETLKATAKTERERKIGRERERQRNLRRVDAILKVVVLMLVVGVIMNERERGW